VAPNPVLRIRVSLKGRPLKTYTFTKDVVTVGRDPSSDIVLDNTSVSREHVKFEISPSGYYAVEDLGSANGTFLNDQPVKRDYVYNNDLVQVGKFSLWVNFEKDRREQNRSEVRPSTDSFQHTTVLSSTDLQSLMSSARVSETRPPTGPEGTKEEIPSLATAPAGARAGGWDKRLAAVAIAAAFIVGTAVGAWAHWLLGR
jgi:hypothetical protein